MLTRRIIVCLDVDAGRVVKGVQFTKLRDAGDPAELAAAHAAAGADEIVLLDITATHEKRATLLETVRRTARELMVPFTVGGGIRSVDDASAVFDAGADKVAVNSAALADPKIKERIASLGGVALPGSPDKAGAPHVTFDLAAGIDLHALTGANARITLTAINVLDTPYLYKFESSFGGTHFGVPRTLAIRIEAGL